MDALAVQTGFTRRLLEHRRGRAHLSYAAVVDLDLGLNTTSTLVVEGGSEVTLTPEEQQALAAARTGKGPE